MKLVFSADGPKWRCIWVLCTEVIVDVNIIMKSQDRNDREPKCKGPKWMHTARIGAVSSTRLDLSTVESIYFQSLQCRLGIHCAVLELFNMTFQHSYLPHQCILCSYRAIHAISVHGKKLAKTVQAVVVSVRSIEVQRSLSRFSV